jgi:NHL repeat
MGGARVNAECRRVEGAGIGIRALLVSLLAFASIGVAPSVCSALPTATHLVSFGGSGSGAGNLAAPADTATDSEGNVWIADTAHHRIQQFDVDERGGCA